MRSVLQRLRGLSLPLLLRVALASVALAACGTDSPAPPDPAKEDPAATDERLGIQLPMEVAHFQRMDILRRSDGNGITAGYALGVGDETVIATVRVLPATGDDMLPLLSGDHPADSAASSEPLLRSIAQMRHFYPHARLSDVHNIYIVKDDQLQGGQAATLQYEDLLGGRRQPIDLDIYMFCCIDNRRAYEFRIRHAADNKAGRSAVAFMQALTWVSPAQQAKDAVK